MTNMETEAINAEQGKFIAENNDRMTPEEITTALNKKFGSQVSLGQVGYFRRKFDLIKQRKKPLNDEQKRLIQKLYQTKTRREVTDIVNEKLGSSVTISQVSNYCRRNGFIRERPRMLNEDEERYVLENCRRLSTMDMTRHLKEVYNKTISRQRLGQWLYDRGIELVHNRGGSLLTNEQADYVLANYSRHTSPEMAEKLNDKFGVSITAEQIKGWLTYRGLRSKDSYLFTVEQEGELETICHQYTVDELTEYAANQWGIQLTKGQMRSWLAYRDLEFKRKEVRDNYMVPYPIGTERVWNGEPVVKLSDGEWRAKRYVVWESVNGPVPEGYVVVPLDRDKNNTDINNLALYPFATVMRTHKKSPLEHGEAVVNEAKLLIQEIGRRVDEYEKR